MKYLCSERDANEGNALVMQGWTKQFLASGERLREATELYESLGLDVHLEPATGEDLACPACQPQRPSAPIEGWYVIYTRPSDAESVRVPKEDLW